MCSSRLRTACSNAYDLHLVFENGYIRASNVNAMVDIADALVAQRAYEANLAVVNISKAMAQRALEIGK